MQNERRQQDGFTLIQLIVAMAIVGLLAASSLKFMVGIVDVFKQKAAVTTVKHMMLAARARAMANPAVHCGVYFALSGSPRYIRMFEDIGKPLDYTYDSTVDKRYGQPAKLDGKVSLSIPPNTPAFPNVIIFRGDGSAWLSGKVVVTTGKRKDTIDVLAATGRVKVNR
jgi:prepilin-type N-terminal cleavage/methylation domain-containing protein